MVPAFDRPSALPEQRPVEPRPCSKLGQRRRISDVVTGVSVALGSVVNGWPPSTTHRHQLTMIKTTSLETGPDPPAFDARTRTKYVPLGTPVVE